VIRIFSAVALVRLAMEVKEMTGNHTDERDFR
jgi:hypothetical protein